MPLPLLPALIISTVGVGSLRYVAEKLFPSEDNPLDNESTIDDLLSIEMAKTAEEPSLPLELNLQILDEWKKAALEASKKCDFEALRIYVEKKQQDLETLLTTNINAKIKELLDRALTYPLEKANQQLETQRKGHGSSKTMSFLLGFWHLGFTEIAARMDKEIAQHLIEVYYQYAACLLNTNPSSSLEEQHQAALQLTHALDICYNTISRYDSLRGIKLRNILFKAITTIKAEIGPIVVAEQGTSIREKECNIETLRNRIEMLENDFVNFKDRLEILAFMNNTSDQTNQHPHFDQNQQTNRYPYTGDPIRNDGSVAGSSDRDDSSVASSLISIDNNKHSQIPSSRIG